MASTFRVSVHVQPGARRSVIVGWADDVLDVRVAAPPVGGRANDALIVLLAEALGVAKSAFISTEAPSDVGSWWKA